MSAESEVNPTDQETPVQSQPPARSASRMPLMLLVVLLIGVGIWFWLQYQAGVAEKAAAEELRELGALALLDGDRKHISSVNLATPKAKEHIEKTIALLKDLPHVKSLNMSNTAVTDEQISIVAGLEKLVELQLSNTSIGDEGLAHVAGLANLTTLYLGGTKVTRAGLKSLAGLSKLEILNLSRSSVEGDLSELSPLNSLDNLLVSDLKLTDDAVDTLLKLGDLKKVSIVDSGLSAEALEKLEESDLKVER